MRNRTLTILLGAALAIVAAAPAQARLVYVKGAATLEPTVFVADDDGTNPHMLGAGHSPTISDNGRWVAWVKPASPDRVVIRRADRRFGAFDFSMPLGAGSRGTRRDGGSVA